MAAQTGNTYISGIMIDSIEILTAILGYNVKVFSDRFAVLSIELRHT